MPFNDIDERSSTYVNNSSPNRGEKAELIDHANVLAPEEDIVLRRFRHYCQENGYYKWPEDGQSTIDDTTLLRFLRAHNFDLGKAIDRFRVVHDWRANHAIDDAYLHMDVQCYEDYRKMFAQWTGRCDRQGLPLYVFPVKQFTPGRMEAYISTYNHTTVTTVSQAQDLPCHILAFHALYENMLKFVMPLCSKLHDSHARAPVSASTHIIDITGVGFGHFWKIRKYLQGAISIATTHYPETLGHIFIVGAPPSFVTVWGVIKKWFDPGSISKILILPHSETEMTLSTYIDPQNLPKQYGGLLSWEWGKPPNLEPAMQDIASGIYVRDQTGDQSFLKGPVTFSDGSVHAWGTVNGELRRQPKEC
ncbi:hypothetical protein RU639_009550 [Aspergillus parasiticus]